MLLSAPSPFTFVLFGASGHLAKLKIYPALYTLALKKRLPRDFAIVGYARSAMTREQFQALVEMSIRAQLSEVNKKLVAEFLEHVHYVQGQYDAVADFRGLADELSKIEKGWKSPVRLAYLSIPPEVFSPVIHNICRGGIHEPGKAFRVIVEKPVGHDLASYEELQKDLTSCFAEDEIYLLDHYLGKEAVRNVYYLRFANPILERLLKNTLIHHVEITASESSGLEGRAGYFESTGTFRDMFQSHLLMIASLLTMHLHDTDEQLPLSRMNALQQFYLPPASNLDDLVVQGQYGMGNVKGETMAAYQEEDGVMPGSRTNTYAALRLFSRESRWQGVPFFLRSGKRLGKKETRVSIQFQEPRAVGEGSGPNRLDIILQGEAGMRLHLQTKVGGTQPTFRPLILEDPLVCMGDCLPEHGILLLEAIHGLKHWFLQFEEVHTAWRLIDPIQAHLDKPDTPLALYPAGSAGPEAADTWIAREGTQWFA
jgi:glucose-6-phosphate 1-dehydrogenase